MSTYKKYICKKCNYIYNEELGDPKNNIPGCTRFEDLPDRWVCPICGAKKGDFYISIGSVASLYKH